MIMFLLPILILATSILADDCEVLHSAYPSIIPVSCCGLSTGTKKDGMTYNLVQCDSSNYITRLEMINNGLQGQVLVDFSTFTRLTYVSLYKNGGLTGSLPRNLPSGLVYIGFLENITGSIPTLPANLQTLYIETTKSGLSGSLPQLPMNLTFLQLIGGSLSGGLPESLPPNLQKLDLQNLGLTGSIPSSVSNVATTHRSLDGNCFSNAANFGVVNNCKSMNGGSSDNVGLIAGIAGGIVVALVASAVLGFILWRKKKKADAERRDAAARYAESFLPKAPAVILTPSRSIINSYTVNYPDITSRLPPPLSPALTAINDASPKLDLYNGILNYTAPVSSNDSYLLPTRNLRPVSANLSVAGNGLYNSTVDLTESGTSISTSTNLPQDPSTWSVTEVAVWIAQNGGRIDGAKRASMQLIDGQALMAAEDVKDIMDIVQCETYGERMRLKNALSVLKGRKKELDAPPSYSD